MVLDDRSGVVHSDGSTTVLHGSSRSRSRSANRRQYRVQHPRVDRLPPCCGREAIQATLNVLERLRVAAPTSQSKQGKSPSPARRLASRNSSLLAITGPRGTRTWVSSPRWKRQRPSSGAQRTVQNQRFPGTAVASAGGFRTLTVLAGTGRTADRTAAEPGSHRPTKPTADVQPWRRRARRLAAGRSAVRRAVCELPRPTRRRRRSLCCGSDSRRPNQAPGNAKRKRG